MSRRVGGRLVYPRSFPSTKDSFFPPRLTPRQGHTLVIFERSGVSRIRLQHQQGGSSGGSVVVALLLNKAVTSCAGSRTCIDSDVSADRGYAHRGEGRGTEAVHITQSIFTAL